MRIIHYIILTTISLACFSCSSKDSGASDRLVMARTAMNIQNFENAKKHIDSIKILYPKAYEEQRLGIILLDSIRYAENEFIIACSESEISSLALKLDSMKANFIYNIDKQYQDEGIYIPKELWSNGVLTSTTLRPGVKEGGDFFIESIYIGTQLHDQLKVSVRDGSFAETQVTKEDGMNYHFSNLGNRFEVIHFDENRLSNVADFISQNATQIITVTLQGRNKYTYQLPRNVKEGIRKSLDLSQVILQVNTLKDEIQKARFRNFKLDEKKQNI